MCGIIATKAIIVLEMFLVAQALIRAHYKSNSLNLEHCKLVTLVLKLWSKQESWGCPQRLRKRVHFFGAQIALILCQTIFCWLDPVDQVLGEYTQYTHPSGPNNSFIIIKFPHFLFLNSISMGMPPTIHVLTVSIKT